MSSIFKCEGKPCIKFLLEYGGIARAAKDLRRQGKTRPAIKILTAAYQQAPGNIKVLTELGLCKLKRKEYRQARAWLGKALKVDPDSTHALNSLGYVYMIEHRDYEARTCWEKTLRIDPDNAVARHYLKHLDG